MATTTSDAPSRSALLSYGAPMVPLAMLIMQIIVYIPPLYAIEAGVSIATVGGIFFLARSVDAFVDIWVGNLSDSTRSRWGRRKPWMAAGVPLLIVMAWVLCAPPAGVSTTYLIVSAVVFYVCLTVVQIPYLSWGAELSKEYEQRTRINGMREGAGMLGTVLATVLPLVVLVLIAGKTNPSMREIALVFVITVTVLLPITVFMALRNTPQGEFVDTGKQSLLQALRGLRKNKLLARLLIGVLLIWLGGSVFNALVIFIVQHTLQLQNNAMLFFVFTQYAVGLLCMPFVLKLANRIGRHRVLVLGAVAFMLPLPLFMLVPPGALPYAIALYALLGTTTSAIWVMPPALVADAIDYGRLQGATDDGALYMGLYHFVQKLAMAGGVGIGMGLAGALGFNAAGANTPESVHALNMVALVLPVFIALPGMMMLFNYPLTRERHDEVRRQLADRVAPVGRQP
jgi:GPH family glycoside/pentoside/hexuronide:cation symporter